MAAGTGTASAATTRHGIEFDRTLDAVDDLGLDPNGNEPVQHKLQNADLDGALVRFPDGEYLVTDRVTLTYITTVGMVGDGDARFVVPENYNTDAVLIDRGQRVLFENIDLDLRADGATPSYKFGAHDTAEIHDVELIGQGIHPDSDPRGEGGGNPTARGALHLVARQPETDFLVENFVAKNRGLMGAYNGGNGRLGVWIGRKTKGTVTLRNCHLSGFPNNGVYASKTSGEIRVEGGVYRNNDIAQVRLGNEGSYVEGAFIESDPATSNSPNPEDTLNGRGVRISSGQFETGRVTVRDCDVRIAENANSEGGVVVEGSGGEFDVVDTRIRVDTEWSPGVRAKRPNSGGNYAPEKPHDGRLKNVSITGSADRGQAVIVNGRPGSRIASCCIEQTGYNRRGFKLAGSDGTAVKNSTIDVTGELLRLEGADVNTWGNTTSGSCPLPERNGASATGSGGDGGSDDGDGGDGDGGDGGDGDGGDGDGGDGDDGDDGGSDLDGDVQRLTVMGGDESVSYSVEVDGEIEGTWSIEDDGDTVGSSTASGEVVGKWKDQLRFTGRIERLTVEGDVTLVYRNGDNSLTLEDDRGGSPTPVDYEASTGHVMWRTGLSGDEPAPESTADGERVTGSLKGGTDKYGCTGELQSVEVDGILSVTTADD